MTTNESLIAFRKRIFEAVTTKAVAGLSSKPELAALVATASESVSKRDDQYWLKSFVPKIDSADCTTTKAQVVILDSIGILSDDDSDSIRDAMDD